MKLNRSSKKASTKVDKLILLVLKTIY